MVVMAMGYSKSDVTTMQFPVITRLVLKEISGLSSAATLALRQGDDLQASKLLDRGEVLLAEYNRLNALVVGSIKED